MCLFTVYFLKVLLSINFSGDFEQKQKLSIHGVNKKVRRNSGGVSLWKNKVGVSYKKISFKHPL